MGRFYRNRPYTSFSRKFRVSVDDDEYSFWYMTGNGVMYNGTTVMDDYGQNLDRLKVMSLVYHYMNTVASKPIMIILLHLFIKKLSTELN